MRHTPATRPIAGQSSASRRRLDSTRQSTGARTSAPPALGSDYLLDGFQTFDGRLGFASERWELGFGLKNLTDVRPQLGTNLLEVDTLSIGRPRIWLFRMLH